MAKQRIYYLVRDLGDGSASVDFFKNKSKAEGFLDYSKDGFDESYNLNGDGPRSFDIDGEISGISFADDEE
jgi:hypothetical protein